jgi:hypothetical protein
VCGAFQYDGISWKRGGITTTRIRQNFQDTRCIVRTIYENQLALNLSLGASRLWGKLLWLQCTHSFSEEPPVMIGISEYGIYKLWGQPIYGLMKESNEFTSQSVREQEVILRRPTWCEWTQLDGWGYSDNPGTWCSRPILVDSKGETHSEVDPGEDSSSDFTSLAKRECRV